MKWVSTNDLINVVFHDPDPSQTTIQQFKTKYGLFNYHIPDPALAKGGNSSWTYAFIINNNSCQARTSISVSAQIIEQDGNIVKIAEPTIGPDDALQAKQISYTVDPYFDEQWHIKNTGQCLGMTQSGNGTIDADCDIEEAWNFGATGAGIKVAVIEKSLFEINHPDLSGQFTGGYDFIDNLLV